MMPHSTAFSRRVVTNRIRQQYPLLLRPQERNSESKRISAILNKYPLPSEFGGLTEEQSIKIANEAVAERRTARSRS
jgi:hypothetical protein